MPKSVNITPLGKIFVLVIIAALAAGGYMLSRKSDPTTGGSETRGSGTSGATGTTPISAVEINFAFGTEKQRWIEWAITEFGKEPAGAKITIKPVSIGSLEGARASVNPDKKFHLFSPGSNVVKDILINEWQTRYGKNPILREELLALTPMVFIAWKDRQEAFATKYPQMTFDTVAQALAEPTGWAGIANKPDWGFFKFGCPDPANSNGGLLALALMAHSHFDKTKALTNADIVDTGFQTWFSRTAGSMTGLAGSSGTMMRDLVLRGPSAYDVIFGYESMAIDYLKQASGRWGELRIVYPKYNMWNDHPCYVLDGDWASAEQKKAADAFLSYLLTPRIQQQALIHGFRPGNPDVAVNGPDSPFTKYGANGLRLDVPVVCQPPSGEAILNLQTAWQRLRNR
jgi:ABC-type Fe3+ transport system substrate-binding protein